VRCVFPCFSAQDLPVDFCIDGVVLCTIGTDHPCKIWIGGEQPFLNTGV
jgi:hypothetical protein